MIAWSVACLLLGFVGVGVWLSVGRLVVCSFGGCGCWLCVACVCLLVSWPVVWSLWLVVRWRCDGSLCVCLCACVGWCG